MIGTIHTLLIEDSPKDARLIQEMLTHGTEKVGRVTWVKSLSEGIDFLSQEQVDVVLLDLSLPDSQAMNTLTTITQRAQNIPIIVITDLADETLAIETVKAGAQDYIVKDQADETQLIRALRHAIERNRVKMALEESERHYRTLVDELNHGVFELDEKGVFLFANEALARIHGYDHPDKLIGRHFIDFIPSNKKDEIQTLFKRAVQAGLPSDMIQVAIQRSDGSIGMIEVSPGRRRIQDGQRTGIRGTVRDITEIVRMEAQMRLQANALEAAANSIIITTPDGVILWCNGAFSKMTGYTLEEVVGQKSNFLKSGLHNEAFYQAMWATITSGQVWHGELINRKKDGTLYAEEMTITPVPMQVGEGEPTHYIAIKQDITARKQNEEAHRRESHLINQMHDAIVELDFEGHVVTWGKKPEQVFGYTYGDMFGKPIHALFTGEQYANWRPQIPSNTSDTSDAATELNLWMRTATDKEVYVRLSIVVAHDSMGNPDRILVYIVDLTEYHQLEEQFRQAQKMEAVGKLAGGVAHDFNNLLTVINGYAEIIKMGLPDDDPIAHNATEIKNAGTRAAGLTAQLLAFSRRQILKPQLIDLNEVVTECSKMLKRLIGEDIELVWKPTPELSTVLADQGQIDQVLMNLAVNARDAMKGGGQLTIETGNVVLDEAYARAHMGTKPGVYVMVEVTDTGHGMDKATIEHIFEPFFTTKPKNEGTGLGLSTVYGIVKQSGGNIWVYSELDIGTTFKIYLPVVASESDVRDELPETKLFSTGSETILLVEDETGVREFISRILSAQGYTVLEATNGAEGLELAQQVTQPIHLLLTDVVMPKMSGRKLADQLNAIHPDTEVLFMSGYTDGSIIQHGVLDPGIDFIQKPFSIQDLLESVRGVLNRSKGDQVPV